MNRDLLDLDLPTGSFPDFDDPIMPSEQWAEWLQRERLRSIKDGVLDPNEIPEWKGEPFVWKD